MKIRISDKKIVVRLISEEWELFKSDQRISDELLLPTGEILSVLIKQTEEPCFYIQEDCWNIDLSIQHHCHSDNKRDPVWSYQFSNGCRLDIEVDIFSKREPK